MKALISSRSVFAAIVTSVASFAYQSSADVVLDWNKITVDATKAGGQNSNLATRIDAIESIAVYDAVNSVLQFGTPYHYNVRPASPASAEAAAAQAAHDVLISFFPAQQATLDAKLATSLSAIPDGPAKQNGRAAGAASAADILALRANDGALPNVTYPGPVNPGVGEWRPAPGAAPGSFPPGINQQWANLKPFLLDSPDQFRVPPPPKVGSKAYQKALAEVQSLGAVNSSVRTVEQAHIAQFYKQDAELPVNEAARLLSTKYNLNLQQNALLFVLLDIAVADARIATWDSKYHYDFWRPVTALNADPDGTVSNNYASWSPHLVTPAHPSYPSGHSATVSSGIALLREVFGNNQALTLQTTTAGESPRSVTSLKQVEIENGLSRIYGGIHYQFDNLQGQKIGHEVARFVLENGPRFKRGHHSDRDHDHDHDRDRDHDRDDDDSRDDDRDRR